ncbi:MAG TPA: glycosyltransferase family 4 protein, partial [Ktedonobacterales bacterium]|nr:glycosyltransferase family 4 protein [Ktedonobacterales bacterium]
ERLPALYASAHVFCAPNTGGESQGVVLLEALAAGRPIVASDIPGFRTVIRNHVDGLLVPPKKHEELAWAVCHLLGDDTVAQRLAAAARMRGLEYSWESVGAQVEAYYQEVLMKRASAERRFALPPAAASYLALPE